MESLYFKTNINCNGCLSKVTPFLNNAEGIYEWSVDINNRDKILTVLSSGITAGEVIDIVQNAGFRIEFIDQN